MCNQEGLQSLIIPHKHYPLVVTADELFVKGRDLSGGFQRHKATRPLFILLYPRSYQFPFTLIMCSWITSLRI